MHSEFRHVFKNNKFCILAFKARFCYPQTFFVKRYCRGMSARNALTLHVSTLFPLHVDLEAQLELKSLKFLVSLHYCVGQIKPDY